jgi:hypothetical protein
LFAAGLLVIVQQVYLQPERLAKLSALVANWRDVLFEYESLWWKDELLQSDAHWNKFDETKRRESKFKNDESEFALDKAVLEHAVQQVIRKRGLNG